MKVGKAPGDDGVSVEMVKWAPAHIQDIVVKVTQNIWETTGQANPEELVDSWPEEWLSATVIPLWKKKHPKSSKHNWRGVTLLSIGAKIIARVVASRIQSFSESFMDEEQQGFRRNRGVDDVLQISRRLTEEICSSRGPTHVHLTLYDIEKAYPRINRQALWTLLKRRGMPEAFVKLCQGLHDFTQFHIRVEGITSRDYTADRGLKEGCPSSPPLFNVYHQAVVTDYRLRRKRNADHLGLVIPGIEWKVLWTVK